MKRMKVLITGSCGLIGSEAARFYLQKGCKVLGIDNNNRGYWFGAEASISSVRFALCDLDGYEHQSLDITDCEIPGIVNQFQPNLIIHCAAQPSHEKSSEMPVSTFEINVMGTINLLEATRKYAPNATFVFLSTNKVYQYDGVRTPFGASKKAADVIVQEYGAYFGLNTVCFRCGCITGKSQQGVEQHGYLNYLCKCAKNNWPYTIYGFDGEQVRDNLHAYDLVRAFDKFAESPKKGVVYDIGGGESNSCTLLEAIDLIEKQSGVKMKIKNGPARKGDFDHWITDYADFRADYDWEPSISLSEIITELLSDK